MKKFITAIAVATVLIGFGIQVGDQYGMACEGAIYLGKQHFDTSPTTPLLFCLMR